MYIYVKNKKIMACSENKQDFSDVGWKCQETDEEIVQIHGQLYKASEAPEPTQEELNQEEKQNLLQYLLDTDYVVLKIAEGVATAEDYADVIAQRQTARLRIRQIDGE